MRLPESMPVLETPQLRLRPFALSDGARLEVLCNAYEIARHTMNIPHPYPEGAGAEWIGTHEASFRAGTAYNFAMVPRDADDDALVGGIGLRAVPDQDHAELGYWVSVPAWGRGYATEAARAIMRFGFETLELRRIYAHHMGSNPASGRVLMKAGMRLEGTLREHIRKWDHIEDFVTYGVLRQEFLDGAGSA